MDGCLSEIDVLEFLDGRLGQTAMSELEHHVDACHVCRDLVCVMAQPSSAGLSRQSVHTPAGPVSGPTFTVGEMVAERHRIVRFIAKGGMGEVYEAADTMLGERVALKTVGAALSDNLALAERLKREVQLARRVTHPNVCRIFDVGVHARGQDSIIFMTMELVAGETLGKRIRTRGPLPLGEAFPLVTQIARALDAAHEAGIIHRDFKSENVLLRDGRAVVTDFGLAQAHAGREARDQRLLRLDALCGGTPHYMAPEQALGETVTARADVYAFGVVIYEMVTGKLPFSSGNAPAASSFALDAKRHQFTPTSPVVHAPGLPARWTRAILRCLERDPARRFAHAGDVLAALAPRRVGWWVAAGLVGLVVTAGIATATLRSHPAVVAAPCPPLDLAAGAVFVDAHVTRAGTGAERCPFRTVTEALDATKGVAGHHIIHIAAGTYDTALGERFPLVVRGDIALAGAGAELTSVVGVGSFDAGAGGVNLDTVAATVVIGDPAAPTELSGIGFAPGGKLIDQSVAVLCDRGDDGPLDGEDRPASTRIVDSTIGPGYRTGVIAAQTEGAGGCNLTMHGDHVVRAGIGLWTVGCGARDVAAQAVSARVENTTFTGMIEMPWPGAAGIVAWDCTTSLTVKSSQFKDGQSGILVISHAVGKHGLIVEDSEFSSLTSIGISVGKQAYIERLTGSSFIGNTAGPVAVAGLRAVGLLLDSSNQDDMSPSVKLARDNVFSGNDIGIELRGHALVTRTFDFGRPDDPGHNVLRCNGTKDGSAVPGHDLVIDAPIGASARLLFAGNTWDHAPPTGDEAVNGGDVVAVPDVRARLDLTGGHAGDHGCSDGVP